MPIKIRTKFYAEFLKTADSSVLADNFDIDLKTIALQLTSSAEPVLVPELSPKENWIFDISAGFHEIEESLRRLKAVYKFLSTIPLKRSHLSPLDYVRYHVENYLNEAYLLQCRLIRYLRVISKGYSKDSDSLFRESEKSISDWIKATLKPIIDLRDCHVHEKRHYDEMTIGLSVLQTAVQLEPGKRKRRAFRRFENKMAEFIADDKLLWIYSNNRRIELMTEEYFRKLRQLLFDKKRNFRWPLKFRAA